MRMNVATMSVVMTDANSRTKRNISWDILHRFRIQGGLEFGRHESIPISWVHQTNEMNCEHCAVESDGYDDQAKCPGKEMLKPKALHGM